MDFLRNNLLTILIFLPTVGAVLTLLARSRDAVRWTTLAVTAVTFALSLLLLVYFDWTAEGRYAYLTGPREGVERGIVQMTQEADWIPAFNIKYKVGIDGLSFPLVILSTFICLLSCIASWNIEKMTKGYMALFLFLETGILGVFLSLDFFLFYVFFEISLLPMDPILFQQPSKYRGSVSDPLGTLTPCLQIPCLKSGHLVRDGHHLRLRLRLRQCSPREQGVNNLRLPDEIGFDQR